MLNGVGGDSPYDVATTNLHRSPSTASQLALCGVVIGGLSNCYVEANERPANANPYAAQPETSTSGPDTDAAPTCGDDPCVPDDSCLDCPQGCGQCPADLCGNDTCEATEHCSTCAEDCGECEDHGPEITRGPYLQNGSAQAVTVRWRTEEPTGSVVAYGLAGDERSWVMSDATPTTEHEVRLEGLAPHTAYTYAIGEQGHTLHALPDDESFVTAIPPGEPGAVRIWAIGDSGKAGSDQDDVYDAFRSYAQDEPADVWLMLGDNAYDDGTDDEYQEAVFDAYPQMLRTTMLWSTVGNHERVDEGGAYFSIFTLPTEGEAGGLPSGTESYYSLDYGNVHLVCLDSDQHDKNEEADEMEQWLVNDLETHQGTWVVAFWHHPPYTKGSHDSDDESTLTRMRERFVPILEDYGVDLVLTGHSHSYERSYLLSGHYEHSSSLGDDHFIDDGDGRIDGDGAYDKGDSPEGAVYVVAGSSSKVSSMKGEHPAMHVSLKELGSMVIDVDGGRLDAKFLDEEGDVRDAFTMFKGAE